MNPVDEVQCQTERICDAYNTIERALTDVDTAEGWRSVLGFVEESSMYGYQLWKRMLTEAVNSNRVEVSDV